MTYMNFTVHEINFIVGSVLLFVVLALFLHFFKIRLLSHSLKLCNWICGMAIGSDSPWVKMLVLHLVFFIRLLMYFAIISLEQVNKLTTRSLFKHYISGSRLVLMEYMSAFLSSSQEIENHLCSRSYQAAGRNEQLLRK